MPTTIPAIEIADNESFERALQIIYLTTARICSACGLKCDLEYWVEGRKKFLEEHPHAFDPPSPGSTPGGMRGVLRTGDPDPNRNIFGVTEVVDGKKRTKLAFLLEQK